ncbi:hypothetical protein PENSPDRAFT_752597 [Peniophora sp. CONT]|nr:hypothetical protein PENSPDRAFT_752597 [Peniophora sp. CONT]
MSQSYFPSQPGTPVQAGQDVQSAVPAESHLADVKRSYIETKDRLLGALDASKDILNDIRIFNKDAWTVRYPHFRDTSAQDAPATVAAPNPRRKSYRRSLSFADEPAVETEVVITPSGSASSTTISSISEEPAEDAEQLPEGENEAANGDRLIPASEVSDDFRVFRLDLKLGHAGAQQLVHQLERASIANLLDDRLTASMTHLDKLRVRVEDTSSKVLVTGDLNAGKSTLVNRLLSRDVMPVDQQPCTSSFCEVHDVAENNGVEEIHIVKDAAAYDVSDESTFDRVPLDELERIVDEADAEEDQPLLKVYLTDARTTDTSLLNNGLADISLIDAPGLNRDNSKTTSIFARQEEIDVVVFVVSAENHFTLSGKEFLSAAANEKAYIFIVVNKFDAIRNKDKCRRLVLEQIKQLSPRTYEEAGELVHFVDSVTGPGAPAFEALEAALRSFVLVKRAKSKLTPAATYLSHLLGDVELLVGANRLVAADELARADAQLAQTKPVLEKMRAGREKLENALEAVEEDGTREASMQTTKTLNSALDSVAQGAPAEGLSLPPYPGLLNVWDYASDVRRALLASLDAAVSRAEDAARNITSKGVSTVGELAEEHLPADVERSKRVFMPQAMFAVTGRRKSVATLGLGPSLLTKTDLLEPNLADFFDIQHALFVHLGHGSSEENDGGKHDELEVANPTMLSVVGLGVGALTMVGGQAVGVRALVEGAVRVADLLGNEKARQWVAPVIGMTVLGGIAYVVMELPSTIPRNIGRTIKRDLSRGEEKWVDENAVRVGRESRKVLRLATWDLRARFKDALEERGKVVRGAEEERRRAERAGAFFEGVAKRAGSVREGAGIVGV